MIRSMTGYGRAQDTVDGMSITVEIKSVNHRYFEFSSRVPRAYGFIEEKLKSYVQSRISRGKTECFVQIEALEDEAAEVTVNHSLAAGYFQALKEIADKYEVRNDISVSTLTRFSDILTVHKAEADEEKIWNAVKTVLEKAVDSFIDMREREGVKLREDISSRADLILTYVEFIEERSPQTVKEYHEKLVARMKELLGDVHIDEQRIVKEETKRTSCWKGNRCKFKIS